MFSLVVLHTTTFVAPALPQRALGAQPHYWAATVSTEPVGRAATAAAPHRARIIASDTVEEDIVAIHAQADAIFAVIDVDDSGEISRSELGGHLTAAGYTAAAVSKVFKALDCNSDGSISQEEFRDGFVQHAPLRNAPGLGDYRSEFVEEIHAEADAVYDGIVHNGDGEISLSELCEHLLSPEIFGKDDSPAPVDYVPAAIEKMFSTLDINGDGKVSREEMREGFVRFSALRIALGNRQVPESYTVSDDQIELAPEERVIDEEEEFRNS
jgi:Ca2+-binding EF-hand superfamily protein